MDLLIDGPDAGPTLVLAHGAGAAMDSAGMTEVATRIAARDVRVVRFEFAYMASRRIGVRKPPPRADTLLDEYRAVLAEVGGRPVIGGRSMGGRVASMIAAADVAAGTVPAGTVAGGTVAGLACLSYPWHPPTRPDQPRVAHLFDLQVPTLIVQGTRDPFGSPDEVACRDRAALARRRRPRPAAAQGGQRVHVCAAPRHRGGCRGGVREEGCRGRIASPPQGRL
jgi:predicted alpha/beta-hydrolase family hydrolase